MKVAVFGATGLTGRELVRQGVTRGHHLTLFARDLARVMKQHATLDVIQGDVTNYPAVEQAITGQDAVVCALGAATPVRRDPSLVLGVRHIIDAMTKAGVPRLVYLSFLGVPEGRHQLSLLGRTVVSRLVLRNVVADHAAKEALITHSTLDWTIVRPPRLTNGPKTNAYRHGEDIKAQSLIPTLARADLADFMLEQLDDRTYIRKAPAVMT